MEARKLGMSIAEHRPATNLLTAGSVWSAVWYLAWPSVLTNVLQTGYGFINLIFVGRVGKEAVAAVGFAQAVLFLQFGMLMGISVGTAALVARFYGANARSDADQATRQSLMLGAICGLLTALPFLLLDEPILRALNTKPEVLPLATAYMDVILYGSPLFFVTLIVTAALRGAGDAKTPLLIMLVQVGLNIVGDWLLIFGVGPFPQLGVIGAGYATVISRVIAMGMAIWFLSRSSLAGSLRGRWWPEWRWFVRILRIGLPAAAQALLRTLSFTVYFGIIGRTVEGTVAIAALAIGLQAESLAFMPGMAFSVAATSLVGQNLGAKQPGRARRSSWVSAGQGAVVMGLMGAAFFFFAESFAALFNDDPEVIRLAASYLRLNALSEPFLGLAMILTGAMQGAGETRFPVAITFVTMWIFRIPLTWVLALWAGQGAVGGWLSMSVTTIVGGLLTTAYFAWGRWTSREV